MIARPSRGRAAAGAAIALGALWLVLAGTLPATVGRSYPDTVLAVRPSAAALVARGEARRHGDVVTPGAAADARSAIARDPTNVKALRILFADAAATKRSDQLRRLLAYSEMLSRRDLATQIALIELRVAGGDVRGALIHYDRALRANPRSTPLLIPILVQATADPQVLPGIAALVAQRPIWWRTLASSMLGNGPQLSAVPAIFGAIRLNPARPSEASLLSEGLGRLVASKRHAEAALLLRTAAGRTPAALRNDGFDDTSDVSLPPFDWSLADEADLSAAIEPSSDDGARGRVLTLTALRKTGVVARQLVMMAPGRYRLSFVAGELPAGDLVPAAVTVRCDIGSRALATMPFARAAAYLVTIPADCKAQWISVESTGIVDGAAMPWIDDIRLSPVR